MALLLLLAASPLPAQEETYEASPGLIPIGGLLLFYNAQGPLSFETQTPRDLPPGAVVVGDVRGKSCQHGVSVPLSLSLRSASLSGAGGDGGYRRTLEALRRKHPGLKGVFDVKVDYHIISVLGLYRRVCTEILARGFK